MTVVPAKVAGVDEIVAVSPAGPSGHPPVILAACHVAGVDTVFRCGGAQAVAALAWGTRTVPRVDKVVGPGNVWVATAKRLCYGRIDIDSIAGPSEVLIVADGRGRSGARRRGHAGAGRARPAGGVGVPHARHAARDAGRDGAVGAARVVVAEGRWRNARSPTTARSS
jgi:hypothetical protein